MKKFTQNFLGLFIFLLSVVVGTTSAMNLFSSNSEDGTYFDSFKEIYNSTNQSFESSDDSETQNL